VTGHPLAQRGLLPGAEKQWATLDVKQLQIMWEGGRERETLSLGSPKLQACSTFFFFSPLREL